MNGAIGRKLFLFSYSWLSRVKVSGLKHDLWLDILFTRILYGRYDCMTCRQLLMKA